MLPRTFLSGVFPFWTWTTDQSPPYTGYVYRQGINPAYDEELSMADAMWDDGEKIVMLHWLNMTAYPSWNISLTWWDRSSGLNVRRLLGNWSFDSANDQSMYDVESPEWEALGTPRDLGQSGLYRGYYTYYGTNLSPYIQRVSYGADGSLYADQGGAWQALTPAELVVQPLQYGYYLGSEVPREQLAYNNTATTREAQEATDRFVVPSPEAPPTPGTADASYEPPPQRALFDPFIGDRTAAYAPLYGLLSRRSQNIAVLLPGRVDSPLAMPYNEIGYPRCFLMLDGKTRTLLVNLNSSYGSAIPQVSNHAVVYIRGGVYQSHVLLPGMPYALGMDEGTRVWALLDDNTAVCFDYLTGEPFVYVWLPLPFDVTIGTLIAWQRDYRRMLVYGLFQSADLDVARNSYASRIAGYSIKPLPVHVCTPIPLKPVRAGRTTPFLVRQVGSLAEPLPGMATVTPGANVAVDRATLAIDESGDARVMVTASTEGEAQITVAIDVEVTWQAPATPQVFCPNGLWVEGSP